MSLKIDSFTFIFLIKMEKENIAKRNSILENVRNFIGSIDFFSESEIKIKPRRIAIENDKFYFSFDSEIAFNMGFTCGEESIDSLNNVMNEIMTKLMEKISLERFKTKSITIYEYVVDKECDFFSKLIQQKNLNKLCYKKGVVSPKRVEVDCNNVDTDSSIEFSFFAAENQNWFRIELVKRSYTQLALNAAKETANLIKEIASEVSKDLMVET